ncbi:hypothetical protein HYQ45_016349 [Verticillium longisporum]|uniref:Uncharacterized protein n=1 Tax=Verticillium longisporum TaxID=100787 RepID=A0A8I3AJ93_VERLO|nr:hypothetical protein HYQ45_016349 [Verticillium longisporum]
MEGLQQGLVRLERRCERFEHRFDALEGSKYVGANSQQHWEVIEGFPETLAEINRMNSQPLNAILEELDQKLGGTLMERKRQLKLLCGVVTELV